MEVGAMHVYFVSNIQNVFGNTFRMCLVVLSECDLAMLSERVWLILSECVWIYTSRTHSLTHSIIHPEM